MKSKPKAIGIIFDDTFRGDAHSQLQAIQTHADENGLSLTCTVIIKLDRHACDNILGHWIGNESDAAVFVEPDGSVLCLRDLTAAWQHIAAQLPV